MDKKSLIIFGILLISISVVASIPQFLIFQGDVKIDGRIAAEGTPVNFSINGTEIANASVDNESKYGPVLIQFEECFDGIDITINNSEAEQKIDCISPQDINLNLSALTGDALNVTNHNPETEIITVTKTQNISFDISTTTGYMDIVNHSWFLDGKSVLNITNTSESSFSYEVNNSDKGKHNITAIANDGFLTVSKEWEIIIERPETENFDGATTDFDSLDLDELDNVEGVVLEKTGKGKIEFLEGLNLSGVTDLNSRVKIKRGIVAIDSSFYPQLDKPAIITLSGLRYNTIPEIFFTEGFTTIPNSINQKCDFCNILESTPHPTTNGEIVFKVDHFSSFKTGESGIKHNLSLFDDLDTCKSGVVGDLDLELKDPDEGDEFGPGEEIEVKVEVKNNADDDKKIIVEASLYNIDEDDEIQNIDDDKKIKDNDDKKFDLILEVPDDFEDDAYLVFVKAYEKGDEGSQCVEGAISIDLEREKHEVIIEDFSINPLSIIAGKSFDVFTEVQNIGESDEDVYVVVEIKELGVLTESETFELEEFGEDDFYSETISIKIPGNAKKGNYTLVIKAIFDGEDDEREETISVLEREPIQMETIFLNKEIVKIEAKEPLKIEEKDLILEKTPQKIEKDGEDIIPLFVPWLLFVGIIVLIILIVTVGLRRRG